jgi:hypothetical protein
MAPELLRVYRTCRDSGFPAPAEVCGSSEQDMRLPRIPVPLFHRLAINTQIFRSSLLPAKSLHGFSETGIRLEKQIGLN